MRANRQKAIIVVEQALTTVSASLLTPTAVRALGFEPVPTRADNPKARAHKARGRHSYIDSDWGPGMGIAICLGRQSDGTNLILLDLDAHTPEQNPDAALAALRARLGGFWAGCVLKRSTTGTGYHIRLRAPEPLPHNQPLYLDCQRIGEVLCEGGICPLVGEPLHGALDDLPLLTDAAWDAWTRAVHIQRGSRNPVSWTARAREVLPMIRGADRVDTRRFRIADEMPKTFAGNRKPHQIAQANWNRLKHARRGERSDAYGNYIQSVMLLADKTYGSTVSDKCRTVAAIAMEDCAEQDEPGYDVLKDTAALIARILHGDQRRNGTGHFLIPYWADDYRMAVRSRGHPARSRAQQLHLLRRFLLRNATGDRVESVRMRNAMVKLTVANLARALPSPRVTPRSVRSYLAMLEQQQEILREEAGGRNGRLVIILLPCFGHLQKDDKGGQ